MWGTERPNLQRAKQRERARGELLVIRCDPGTELPAQVLGVHEE